MSFGEPPSALQQFFVEKHKVMLFSIFINLPTNLEMKPGTLSYNLQSLSSDEYILFNVHTHESNAMNQWPMIDIKGVIILELSSQKCGLFRLCVEQIEFLCDT